MLDKRFEIYSEAFNWCDKLKILIHQPEDEKIKETKKARDWFSQNALYLEPDIRKSFYDFINEVEMYKHYLEEYKHIGQKEGWSSTVLQQKKDELEQKFHEIMFGIQSKIQNKIDIYFKIIQPE